MKTVDVLRIHGVCLTTHIFFGLPIGGSVAADRAARENLRRLEKYAVMRSAVCVLAALSLATSGAHATDTLSNAAFAKRFNDSRRGFWLRPHPRFASTTYVGGRASTRCLAAPGPRAASPPTPPDGPPPRAVDWRTAGHVDAVEDQGACGSCWAFASASAVAARASIDNGTLYNLSAQELVDCTRDRGNRGCAGGSLQAALEFAAARGLCNASSYPYRAADGACRRCPPAARPGPPGFVRESEASLMRAVARAPVAAGIDAGLRTFQLYAGGVYDDMDCTHAPDHAVLVVGYGDDGGRPYWTLKNSWGAQWGERGYARIARDTGLLYGLCNVAQSALYPRSAAPSA